jgi:hypothetical protein
VGEDLDTDVAGASGHLLADGGGPCPTDALGRPRSRFRPGDVLRVSCPLRETEVVDANRFHVCVRWPWRWLQEAQDRQDQASGVDNSKWRGSCALTATRTTLTPAGCFSSTQACRSWWLVTGRGE